MHKRINTEKDSHRTTVVTCYSTVERFFPACGLFDLTEGIYDGDPGKPYEQAQRDQHNYLLRQLGCRPGYRILDIGCGYGTLLEGIRQLDATGVGITISPEQVEHCQKKRLDIQLLDYREIPVSWNRTFDGVVANGSIEHFVDPREAAKGKADDIYRDLFERVHKLINPYSSMKRFVTTTIHFVRKPNDPLDILKSPFDFHWGSDNFHWAVLGQGWGGYYPEIGQLNRCANGYFHLIEEIDGTEDYFLSSEEWLRRVRQKLLSLKAVKIACRSLPVFVRSPRQFLIQMLYLFFSDSWNWQFRPPAPPTRLLRQTWAYQG
jgi:cyclopropane-fatty-acyl-phospholipid synthase